MSFTNRTKAILLGLSATNILGFAFYFVSANGGLSAVVANLVDVWYASLVVSVFIFVGLVFIGMMQLESSSFESFHLTRRLKYLAYFAIGDFLTIIPALGIIYGLVSFVMTGWYISLFLSGGTWICYIADWAYQGMDEFL